MFRPLLLAFLILFALPLQAEENGNFRFGGDAYLAGRTAVNSTDGLDSLFAFADRVTSAGALVGSGYLAGRRVTISAPVGVNLYAAGATINLSAPVGGDALLMGDSIIISAPIDGSLRAMGNQIDLTAPVGKSALLAGQEVYVNAPVGSDLGLAGEDISFGPNAQVAGMLHVYGYAPDAFEVPASVAAPDKVVWHPSAQPGMGMAGGDFDQEPGFWTRLKGFVGQIIVVGVLAAILAAIAPQSLAAIRARALEAPLRTAWIGFLALSATFGSLIMLMMTGLGIILIPVSLLSTFLLALVGYLIGVYVLGVGVAKMLGRQAPETFAERAMVAFVGASAIAALGLIPFAGWFITLALALLGAGGLMIRLFAPGFYTELR